MPATNSALQDSHGAALPKVFRRKSASKDNIKIPKRSFRAFTRFLKRTHVQKSRSLHLSRYQSASKITTMSTELRLPRNLHIEKNTPIPCTCHEQSTLDHHNTRFPLRLPQTVTTMPENVHGATTRVQSRQAPTVPHQIVRACAVEMHFEDFERHECTVNSNELAGRPDATPRFNTGP